MPDPDDVRRTRTAYWALVHRLDTMIGRILNALRSSGLMDETLIVYASDHGDHVGERGLWWKHSFYEESVGVPLLMRLPGVLPAGERRREVVSLIDLAQTMLEATGSPAPSPRRRPQLLAAGAGRALRLARRGVQRVLHRRRAQLDRGSGRAAAHAAQRAHEALPLRRGSAAAL